jgi:hypothetical protein
VTAAEEEVETYDATGRLLSIQNRAGLTTTLEYSDGTANEPLTDLSREQARLCPPGCFALFETHSAGSSSSTTTPPGELFK